MGLTTTAFKHIVLALAVLSTAYLPVDPDISSPEPATRSVLATPNLQISEHHEVPALVASLSNATCSLEHLGQMNAVSILYSGCDSDLVIAELPQNLIVVAGQISIAEPVVIVAELGPQVYFAHSRTSHALPDSVQSNYLLQDNLSYAKSERLFHNSIILATQYVDGKSLVELNIYRC